MKIKKILWPTDFSNSAQKALVQVTSLTEKYNSEIHVLYVHEDLAHLTPWYGEFNEQHVTKVIEFSDKAAKKKLEHICSKYLNNCPLYIRHVVMGDPAQQILKFIEQEKIDMVVMATRGSKGHFPFGSVTEKVVKNSPVSVVVVPVEGEA